MALRQITRDTLPSLLKDLKKDISKPYRIPQPLPSLRRTFSLYDQINLIDNVPEDQLRFRGFDDTGFKVNGVRYEGSLLCVGNLLMSWSPKKFVDITPERSPLLVEIGATLSTLHAAADVVLAKQPPVLTQPPNSAGNINRTDFRYYVKIPQLIFPFMEGWINVIGDGNCGFRCVANKFHGTEDRHLFVRNIIANELDAKVDHYSQIYRGQDFVREAIRRIRWIGGSCGREHWMEAVFDLFPIANLYNSAVVFYTYGNNRSLSQCTTILPTDTPDVITTPQDELHIAYIEQNQHYFQLRMSENSLIPPILDTSSPFVLLV